MLPASNNLLYEYLRRKEGEGGLSLILHHLSRYVLSELYRLREQYLTGLHLSLYKHLFTIPMHLLRYTAVFLFLWIQAGIVERRIRKVLG